MGSAYCNPSDLTLTGINPIALQDVDPTHQQAACDAANSTIDDHFGGRYQLPLLAWPPSVTFRAAQIAVYIALKARGFNPDAGADPQWVTDYKEAIAWCEGVQRQSIHPQVTQSAPSPGNAKYDLPQVLTGPQRGWGQFGRGGTPSVS